MTAREALAAVLSGRSLERGEMAEVMGAVMDGKVSESLLAGILVALVSRGETAEEISGAVDALRARCRPFPPEGSDGLGEAIDVCGTGGDRAGTVNLSTAVSFVLAAGGVSVVKHGNRAVSSQAGSADVLEALGIPVEVSPEKAFQIFRKTGLTFLFAPFYHPALRVAAGVRRELGVRTLFNLLGPLANPARVRRQVIGVYDPARLETVVDVLAKTGSSEVMALHGDGLDEVNLASTTTILHLSEGRKLWREVRASDFGLSPSSLEAARGGDRMKNAALIHGVLEGERHPLRDWVLAGAAPGFMVAGHARTLPEGVSMAREAIDSGKALAVLTKIQKESLL
ncbi:MAG: anthranilate phosphoribosyltransferase [Leptospirillia bacterium]